MKKINSIEEFDKEVQNNSSVLLLKHSLTCPISQAAFDEYQQFTEANENVNAYYLAVQDSRPLSNHIAESYQIKHESPQVLLFSNNDVVWNASHRNITVDALTDAVNTNK
ncbi:bacillithiol system redox-active protein YtxJ [Niallia sp. 01092]|uniref:bacillithiol system redox-active protein YtxJ n=1 Tax=unclassified Niallia TaxID=2837522 RepID=UPI003FD3E1CE